MGKHKQATRHTHWKDTGKSSKSKSIQKTKPTAPPPPVWKEVADKLKFLEDYNKKLDPTGFATWAVHYGQPPDPFYGSVNMPIHMTSTYAQYDAA